MEAPAESFLNEEIRVKIKMENTKEYEQHWEIWSYLYKGPKSISGERTENLQEITIPSKTTIYTTLTNKVEEGIKEGNYNLKIKFKEKEKKTPKELTQSITLKTASAIQTQEEIVQERKSRVVFAASEEKAKNLGVYIFSSFLILLVIELVRKKDI